MTKTYNADHVTELTLYIENTSAIYHAYTVPAVRNLAKHYAKGNFDEVQALKVWRRVADAGAKAYVKEFGSLEDYTRTFSTADRDETAKRLADLHKEHINGTNPL